MPTFIHRTILALVASAAGCAQVPELIRGLSAMNSASLAGEGLPDAGVAPGARFALLGRALDTAPRESIRAAVAIDGATADAAVVAVSAKRIDLLLPLYVPLGRGTVTLDINGTRLSAPIRVVERAFGIFAEPVPGSGGRRLRGTGLGRDDSPAGIEVLVAGQAVPAGGVTRHPDGFEDIDFEVPAGLASCGTPIAVRASGRISNAVLLPTAPDCPQHGSAEERNHGTVTLSRSESAFEGFRQTADFGAASFFRAPGAGLSGSASVRSGSCALQYFIEQDPVEEPLRGLDAGPRLEVAGPKGTRDLAMRSKGLYDRDLGQVIEAAFPGFPEQPGGLFLEPGEYNVTGFGGVDIGPFTARLEVPVPAVWTNREVVTAVDRTQDLRIEWRDASEHQFVTFSGFSIAATRPLVGASFTCIERGDKGALTVPAQILSALPASSGGDNGQVIFAVTPERPAEFTAAGLDGPGAIDYSQDLTSPARFR